MKYRVIQNAFISGELSSKLDARTDIKEYKTGVAQLENFFVRRQGGVSRRPGFKHVADFSSITSTAKLKLLPFIYSKNEAYVVAIEVVSVDSIKIKIYNNAGTKVYDTATTIGAASGADAARGLPNLDEAAYGFNGIQSADVMFLTHAEGVMKPLVIARTASDTFTVTSYLTYYFSSTQECLAHPFQDTNVNPDFRILWAGNEDASYGEDITFDMYDTTGGSTATDRQPFFRANPRAGHHGTLVRVNSATKSFIAQIKTGTDGIPAVDGLTIASHESGNVLRLSGTCNFQVNDVVTFTGTSSQIPTNITASQEYYVKTVSGTDITISETRQGTTVVPSGNTGATCNIIKTSLVNADLIVDTDAGISPASVDNWAIGSWGNYQGYPRTVTAFEQRLIWGGSIQQPDTVWGSLLGNMFHMMEERLDQDKSDTADASGMNFFAASVQATDPFQFTLAAQEVNAIQWMSSQRGIEVGTLGAEYIISGGDNAISSSNVQVQVQTNHGGSSVRPVRVARGTLFVSRDGQLVREFKYNNDEGSYITQNFSITSDEIIHHLFTDTASYAGTKILDMAYQNSRGILWFVTSNNALVGVTLDADTGTIAWHRHTLGGTDAAVQGLCVIPNSDGTFDDLYISIKRTIDGGNKWYLEKIGDDFEHTLLKNVSTSDDDQPYFSDSSLRIKLADQTSSITHSGVSTGSDTITFGSNHNLGTGTKFRFSAVGGTLSWQLQTSNAFTANASNEQLTFVQDHGLAVNDLLRFSTSNTLPAGLSTGTDYQVNSVVSSKIITVKASGGSAINITDTGTGIHRLIKRADVATSIDYYCVRHSATAIKIAINAEDAFNNNYVDLITTGSGTHTIAPSEGWLIGGLAHLEGEEVEVLADGFHEQDGFIPSPLQFINSAISDSSGLQIALPDHNLFPGTKVQLASSTGTLPTGLSADTDYYVNWVSWDAIRLSTTEAGALAGTGLIAHNAGAASTTYTVYPMSSPMRVKDGMVGISPTYSAGGAITGAITEAIVGIKYISKLKTMKLDAGQEFGTSQGSLKRNEAVILKFHKTYGGKFGTASDESNLEEIVFREAGHGMGSALTLFTGDKYLDFPGTAERFFQVVVHQDKPLPMSLLGIIHRGVTYD